MKKKFYLTTAIAYLNAPPHIGFALESLYADVLARHYRIKGEDVFFLTGSDEHGSKIAKTAAREKIEPQAFCNKQVILFQRLKETLNLSYDDFIRTTEERHKKGVEKFWQVCLAAGDIYKKEYTGLYCLGCEAFKTKKDLINGLCPDHETAPEEIKEENYFFRLSRYQPQLLNLLSSNEHFIYPHDKYNEIYEIVKNEKLEDISISRSRKSLNWGIPVPGDADQVIYVWFDALINYLTGVGYGSDEKEFKKWWPADLHIIGKEINRFHTLLWPAMLLSTGLPLPKKVAVHGWITHAGQKMSKTLGNVIDPFVLVDEDGLDPVRFFLLQEIPFDRDGDYSRQRFKERYNADLANELGNLLTRVSNMVEKFFDGQLPAMEVENSYDLSKVGKLTEELKFDLALEEIWAVIKTANQYIDREKPWELFAIKNMDKLGKILNKLIVLVRDVALALEPFLPDTSLKIQNHFSRDRIVKMPPLFPRILI